MSNIIKFCIALPMSSHFLETWVGKCMRLEHYYIQWNANSCRNCSVGQHHKLYNMGLYQLKVDVGMLSLSRVILADILSSCSNEGQILETSA